MEEDGSGAEWEDSKNLSAYTLGSKDIERHYLRKGFKLDQRDVIIDNLSS